jgi:hypothetical protein
MADSLLFVPLINGCTTCFFRSLLCTYTQGRPNHKCHPSWRDISSIAVWRDILPLNLIFSVWWDISPLYVWWDISLLSVWRDLFPLSVLTNYHAYLRLTRYFPLFPFRRIILPLSVWWDIPPVILKTAQLLQNVATVTPNSQSLWQ